MSTIEDMTEFMRTELDWLQKDKVDALEWAGIPRKDLFASLSLLRECMTTMKKHYPKAPEIYTDYMATDMKHCVATIERLRTLGNPPPVGEVSRVRDFLNFPQRFHDTWDDRNQSTEGQFPIYAKWRARRVHEIHVENIDNGHFILAEDDPRLSTKQYEKEKKEWAKKHGN